MVEAVKFSSNTIHALHRRNNASEPQSAANE